MWIRALQREGLYVAPNTHLRSSLKPLRTLRVLAVPTSPVSALVTHILGDYGATVKTVAIKGGHGGRVLDLESEHAREYFLNVARKSDVIVSGCSQLDLARKHVDISSLRRAPNSPLFVHIAESPNSIADAEDQDKPSSETSFSAAHAACALVAHLYCHAADGTAGHELTIKPEDYKTFLDSLPSPSST